MFSRSQILHVEELLQVMINAEKQLEQKRQEITKDKLFSLKPIFMRLDHTQSGFISSADFISFFQQNNIEITLTEAFYLLRWLDRNQDGKVTFDDISQSFLPKEDYKQRVEIALREPYNLQKQMILPDYIEKSILLYFSELLQNIRVQTLIKKQLFGDPTFNIFDLYRTIDKNNQGSIDENSFLDFIYNFRIQIDENDIQYIFWIADHDQDGKITYQEFIEMFMNCEKGKQVRQQNYNFPKQLSAKILYNPEKKTTNQSSPTQESRIQEQKAPLSEERQIKKGNNDDTKVDNQHKIEQPENQQKSNFMKNEVSCQNSNTLNKVPISQISKKQNYLNPSLESKQNYTQSAISIKQEQRFQPNNPTKIEQSNQITKNFSPEIVSKKPKLEYYHIVQTNTEPKQRQTINTPYFAAEQNQYLTHKRAQTTYEYKTPERILNETRATLQSSTNKEDTISLTPEKQMDYSYSKSNIEQRDNEYIKYINSISRTKESKQSPQKLIQNEKNKYFSLFKLFLKQILLLREIEENKRQLTLRQDFNLMDAFRILDQRQKGAMDLQQLQNGFEKLNLQFNQEDLERIFKQYSNSKKYFKYSDFHLMMVSQTQDYANLLLNRVPNYKIIKQFNEIFTDVTIKIFKQLMELIVESEKIIGSFKNSLTEPPEELFAFLDIDNKKYLIEEDFRNFLEQFDVHPTALELRRLVARYLNEEGKVDFDSFCNQLKE